MQALTSTWNKVRNFNLERYIFGPNNPAVSVSRLFIFGFGTVGLLLGLIQLAVLGNRAWGEWVWAVPLGMLILSWIVWALKPHRMD